MLYNTVSSVVSATGIFLVTLWLAYVWRFNAKVGHRLPPGPRGLPLLGNLLQVPGKHTATYLRRLIKEYGSLVSLNLAGYTVILLGDMQIAKALLEKHSAKHSSRPVMRYFLNYVDPNMDFWVFSGESDHYSLGRKLTVISMSAVRAGETAPLQEYESTLNIQHLLDDGGKDWFRHIQRTASSTVLTAAFGMHCPTGREPGLQACIDVLAEVAYLSTPSASIINVFPFLDLIPGPMPWRTRAQMARKRMDTLFKKLIDDAITREAYGMKTWAAFFAKEDKPEGDQRNMVKLFALAAIETTTISLLIFVLACIRYPSWITTAQKEMDNVVGADRLPTLKDRPALPYVEAVFRETLRWRPAVRFGIPHRSTADDVIEYQGEQYFIPKDSIILAVTWAIEHDQSIFEDHDRFMPERFLDSEGKLKPNYETSAFGFGRRVCPGVPFAERTLWINIAAMLWTFNIRASKDPKTGLPLQYDDSDAAFNGDITNMPFKFPAVFEPRSLQRVEVARREWAEKDPNVLTPLSRET